MKVDLGRTIRDPIMRAVLAPAQTLAVIKVAVAVVAVAVATPALLSHQAATAPLPIQVALAARRIRRRANRRQ